MSDLLDLSNFDINIGAIFSSGIKSPMSGLEMEIISAVNFVMKEVYSIDIPSGLPCDDIFELETIVKSSHVISF